jgi:hypothetical protein
LGQAALYALRLLRDPARTEYVFLAAYYTNVLWPGRLLEHFATPPATLPTDTDDPESLGGIYARYMKVLGGPGLPDMRTQVSGRDQGSFAASLRRKFFDRRKEYRAQALTAQHDLWHVLTGYSTDEVGEVCLQAFVYAQVGTPLSLLITGGGLLRACVRGEWSAFGRVRRAYARGLAAQPLLLANWQALWPLPPGEVRNQLHLKAESEGDRPVQAICKA